KISLSWHCRAGHYQFYALARSARDKHAHGWHQGYARAARYRAGSGVCDMSFAVYGVGPACAGWAATRAPTPLTTTPAPTEPTLPISMGTLHRATRRGL